MASVVAAENELLALFVDVLRHRDENTVGMECRRGGELVTRIELPFSALDLADRFKSQRLWQWIMPLSTAHPEFQALIRAIRAARRADSEPLWMHLPRTAPELAFIPWEEQFADFGLAPLLRIPNFVHDPLTGGDRHRVAILASSPLAKGSYEVAHMIRGLVERLIQSDDGTRLAEIHVFVDQDAFEELSAFTPWRDDRRIVIHDPAAAGGDSTVAATRSISATRDLQNPWMLWMANALQDRPIDILHVVSPGYVDDYDGALALAETPTRNVDRSWSRFVGAAELDRLMDTLGILGLVLHPVAADGWAAGLRHLAWQMTWLRPGPVVCTRGVDRDDFEDAGLLHRLLSGVKIDPSDFTPGPFRNIHPRHLTDGDEVVPTRDVASDLRNAGAAIINSLSGAGQFVGMGIGPVFGLWADKDSNAALGAASKSREFLLNVLAHELDRPTRGEPPPTEPSTDLALRRLDARRAQIMTVEPLSDRDRLMSEGASEALDFIETLLRSGRGGGGVGT